MSSTRAAEIVITLAFLLALLLPIAFGTDVARPRSVFDFLSGFSRFNLSLYKFLLAPGIGLGLVVVLYADASLPWFVSLAVLAVGTFLFVECLILGAKRRGREPSQSTIDAQDNGLDYANRFRRLEDQIESSTAPSGGTDDDRIRRHDRAHQSKRRRPHDR
jgi:hypothetical protein